MRRGTLYRIDLSKLLSNIEKLKTICPRNEILFMVKSDGYGHGCSNVSALAIKEAGITEFGVATLDEGIFLRQTSLSRAGDIYVFSDLCLEDEKSREAYLSYRLIPVISNLRSLKLFLKDKNLSRVPLVVKVNIGMNRLGFFPHEMEEVISQIKNSKRSIHHLMGHFSNSSYSVEIDPTTFQQEKNFQQVKRLVLSSGIQVEKTSLSNSGAIEQKVGLEETHIRPGLMLYGPSALNFEMNAKDSWKGEIIGHLEAVVLHKYLVTKGTMIGYGSTPSPDDGLVLLFSVGYGDGFPTRFSGGKLRIKDKDAIVVGRVNMDMIQVLIPKVSNLKFASEGESVELWHNWRDLKILCEENDVIPYELFCQITARIPKIYSRNV